MSRDGLGGDVCAVPHARPTLVVGVHAHGPGVVDGSGVTAQTLPLPTLCPRPPSLTREALCPTDESFDNRTTKIPRHGQSLQGNDLDQGRPFSPTQSHETDRDLEKSLVVLKFVVVVQGSGHGLRISILILS